MRIAVLDDYQGVARDLADWSALPDGSEIEVFRDHLADESELVARLQGFQAVIGMRERTPFPRSVLAGLPDLRLLITTGGRNASFDVDAATDLGIVVCGTGGAGEGPTELTWGLIIGLLRKIPQEDRLTREGRLADHHRRGPEGQDPGPDWAGPHRRPDGSGGQRLPDEGNRLEPEPHRRAGRRV